MAELNLLPDSPQMSLVILLAARRADIIRAAEEDGGRDLTPAEEDQMAAWGSAIVCEPARTPQEAAIHVAIAKSPSKKFKRDCIVSAT